MSKTATVVQVDAGNTFPPEYWGIDEFESFLRRALEKIPNKIDDYVADFKAEDATGVALRQWLDDNKFPEKIGLTSGAVACIRSR